MIRCYHRSYLYLRTITLKQSASATALSDTETLDWFKSSPLAAFHPWLWKERTIVTPTPAVFKLTISAPTIYSSLHLWQGSLGYCEDVTEALCCSRYEDTKAFAGNPDAAGAGKSGFWTAGYDPCSDRGEHPPPWPAGEPHQGPQRAQTDAVASLKWYRVLFMLSVNTGGQAELGFGF